MKKKVNVIAINSPYGGVTTAAELTNFPAQFKTSETAVSSPLGHLFNQGYVSAELLLNDNKMKNEIIQKIKNDTKSKADKNKLIEHLKNDEFEVVYAIITKKSKVTDLPLFTKIALVKAWKNLNRLQIKSNVIFIEDKS